MGQIGRSVRRLEDRPLLTGAVWFAADIAAPGALYMRVVRSPAAFGRRNAIRHEEAARCPGVVAMWTAADVADIPPIDFRMTPAPGLETYRQPILARDHVRYVGEPLAAVFAADPYSAEDAADLVMPDIETLAPCLDIGAEPDEWTRGECSEAAGRAKGLRRSRNRLRQRAW
jgi:CO/xanthine dehydrogenase Mo-binding subunit